MIKIPIELLKEFVKYDAQSPSGLTWKKLAHLRASRKVGDHVGRRQQHCWSFKLHGVEYKNHRVIWALLYEDPGKFEIDHIDRDPFNNCIENLRLATRRQNAWNRGKQSNGHKSKHLGVSFHRGRWRMNIDKIEEYFETELEAALRYNEIALHTRGTFASLNEL